MKKTVILLLGLIYTTYSIPLSEAKSVQSAVIKSFPSAYPGSQSSPRNRRRSLQRLKRRGFGGLFKALKPLMGHAKKLAGVASVVAPIASVAGGLFTKKSKTRSGEEEEQQTKQEEERGQEAQLEEGEEDQSPESDAGAEAEAEADADEPMNRMGGFDMKQRAFPSAKIQSERDLLFGMPDERPSDPYGLRTDWAGHPSGVSRSRHGFDGSQEAYLGYNQFSQQLQFPGEYNKIRDQRYSDYREW